MLLARALLRSVRASDCAEPAPCAPHIYGDPALCTALLVGAGAAREPAPPPVPAALDGAGVSPARPGVSGKYRRSQPVHTLHAGHSQQARASPFTNRRLQGQGGWLHPFPIFVMKDNSATVRKHDCERVRGQARKTLGSDISMDMGVTRPENRSPGTNLTD